MKRSGLISFIHTSVPESLKYLPRPVPAGTSPLYHRFAATLLAGILLFTTTAAGAVPVADLVFTDPNLAACVNNTAATYNWTDSSQFTSLPVTTWGSPMRAVSRR